MREAQKLNNHGKSLEFSLFLVLGPICRGQDRHFRENNRAKAVRFEDRRVEQVLWQLP